MERKYPRGRNGGNPMGEHNYHLNSCGIVTAPAVATLARLKMQSYLKAWRRHHFVGTGNERFM
jgi:hypothetical protein